MAYTTTDTLGMQQLAQARQALLNQAQLQPFSSTSVPMQAELGGLWSGGIGSGLAANAAIWEDYATLTASSGTSYYPTPNPIQKTLKFFRVNELVEVPEGRKLDPIDELRVKVQKWLS